MAMLSLIRTAAMPVARPGAAVLGAVVAAAAAESQLPGLLARCAPTLTGSLRALFLLLFLSPTTI